MDFPAIAREHTGPLKELGFRERASNQYCLVLGRKRVEVSVCRHPFGQIDVGIACGRFRFGLYDLMYASGDCPEWDAFCRHDTVSDEAGVERVMALIQTILVNYCGGALSGDVEYLERIDVSREARKREWYLEHLAYTARPKERQAFKDQRYAEAAKLYGKIEPILTRSERAKLAYARRQAGIDPTPMMRPPTQTLWSPEQVFRVVRGIAEAVQAGELNGLPGSSECVRLQDIAEGQPWPADYIELDFEDSKTGTRYRLSIETYHGCGGVWKEL